MLFYTFNKQSYETENQGFVLPQKNRRERGRELSDTRPYATAEDVKCKLLGLAPDEQMLVSYFRKYYESFQERVGINSCSTFSNVIIFSRPKYSKKKEITEFIVAMERFAYLIKRLQTIGLWRNVTVVSIFAISFCPEKHRYNVSLV